MTTNPKINLDPYALVIDERTRTIRPMHAGADDYFGLSQGTNGTATESRRAIAVATNGAPHYSWKRANGSPPAYLNYTPASGNEVFENPWN